ncbi:hypothetical protein CROQUDRAFT_101704 [Cronartium quercuum f. sp. fusiforme G11]|uniref:DNA2/NAM7 helicase helicase domain-containing protein n=1 Tax=Cronartium quercuum f. sp. fusiforme G11 TaxID=708437 RepID=A0A9P6T5B6_9BASI|nr:hypothetical protein CROQUDRAFT_101704 [Cronartium quercuum f. sp. fusiforme G11]
MTAVQYTPACWIPILKSKHKVILAGDPCQLPPTINSIKHASTSQTKAKKNTPGKALPKVKEIVKGEKGNLVAGKSFKAKDDNSKSKETKSIDAEKTEGDSKDNQTEIQPTQSTSNGKSEDKSDSDGSQTKKETESFEKFTVPSGLGRKLSTPVKWSGPQFFKMKPPKLLEVTMFDRLLKSNSSMSCLLDVQYVSDWEKPTTEVQKQWAKVAHSSKKPSPNLPRSSSKSPVEILESNASAEVFTISSKGWEPKKLLMRN